MKNLNKREKYLLIIMAIGIIGYVYLNYFLFPILDNIKTSQNNIDTYNSQINQLRIIGITNKKLNEELSSVKLKYQRSLATLPEFEKNPEIAYNINELAKSNNVLLKSIGMGDKSEFTDNAVKSQTKQTFYSVPVSLSVTADNYLNIMDFVAALESDKRLAAISSLSIQGGGTKPGLQGNMTINYLFTQNNSSDKPQYDFNKGTYGKTDLFR